MSTLKNNNKIEDYDENKIYSNNIMTNMMSTMSAKVQSNNLEAFKNYIENGESNLLDYSSAISYSYNLDLQIFKDDTENIVQVNPNDVLDQIGMGNMNMMYMSTSVFAELFDNDEMNNEMYEVISGRWPQKYNEVVLLVDEDNQIMDYTLYAMGLKDSSELSEMYDKILKGEEFEVSNTTYNVDDFVGMKFKFLLNSDYYVKENNIWIDKSNNEEFLKDKLINAEELVITGVIKPSDGSLINQTSGGILYLKDLKEYVINKINDSEIVKEQIENPNVNIFTGKEFSNDKFDMSSLSAEQLAYLQSLSPTEMAEVIENFKNQAGITYEEVLSQIGVIDLNKPSTINIYPKDFESKDEIINIIDNYNDIQRDDNHEGNVINYSDVVGVMMRGVSTIINVISYVLMAFVSISLIVSSIMIGIITYISVLERTKEIGILRSIGASKKDISRVFNAETFIVGLIAGVMGIVVTIILNIPINLIIKKLTDISNLSVLPIWGALILIVISTILTIIAGLIPSKIASKKDPVEALRVE